MTTCSECGAAMPKRFRKCCSAKCRQKATNRRYAQYHKEWQRAQRGQKRVGTIQCNICGKWYVQIGSHVTQVHGMTAREYREEEGYDVKRGLIPEHYRQLKASQVTAKSLANLEKGKAYWFKPGQEGLGKYQRSEQTMRRLKDGTRINSVCRVARRHSSHPSDGVIPKNTTKEKSKTQIPTQAGTRSTKGKKEIYPSS